MKLREAFKIYTDLLPKDDKTKYCICITKSEKFRFEDVNTNKYLFYNKITDIPDEVLDKNVIRLNISFHCVEVLEGETSEKN